MSINVLWSAVSCGADGLGNSTKKSLSSSSTGLLGRSKENISIGTSGFIISSVYGNSTERGSFLIGIGAAGSKHRLLSDMLMLFERLVDENRFTEEEAGYVRENKDAFLAMCIAPLAQGAHLYVDYSECVVAIVKALSKLTGHKIWIPVANRRVDD